MESVIIGTAGHVDHGKTVLIRSLTGVDTDRLQEEKERGISIDLGFASFSIPGGRMAGIVDVPGHERFIHNMLAGVGGMDLVMLVVDASEGVMPQTREHLGILELLGVQKGLVVLTKIDLVEEEWCDIVEEEIRDEVNGTFFEDALIHRVSAVSGSGIEELKDILRRLTDEIIPRNSLAPYRFPVDRNFIIAGFGTVVTGTLLQGTIKLGDMVEILPSGKEARVRNLQVFNSDVNEATAGHRVAINLSGIERSDVERGSVICRPGYFSLTTSFDAKLNMLKATTRVLQHNDPVHLYIGTARIVARAALLDRAELHPGEVGMVQLRLEAPVVAERKDRFIIRSYSPMTTIGGGIVLDPLPGRRHRRFRDKVLNPLQELEKDLNSNEQKDHAFVWQKIKQLKFADLITMEKTTRLGTDSLTRILEELVNNGQLFKLADAYIDRHIVDEWHEETVARLNKYHQNNPLAEGLSRAELKSVVAPGLSQKDFDAFLKYLINMELVEVLGDRVKKAGFSPGLSGKDKIAADKLLSILHEAGYQPPVPIKLAEQLGLDEDKLAKILQFYVNRGELIRISNDMYLLKDLYIGAVEVLQKHFTKNEQITMGQFRDYLESTRKYVQPLLEHFDQEKITRRRDDYRVLIRRQESR